MDSLNYGISHYLSNRLGGLMAAEAFDINLTHLYYTSRSVIIPSNASFSTYKFLSNGEYSWTEENEILMMLIKELLGYQSLGPGCKISTDASMTTEPFLKFVRKKIQGITKTLARGTYIFISNYPIGEKKFQLNSCHNNTIQARSALLFYLNIN